MRLIFDARSLVGSHHTGVGTYVLGAVKALAEARPNYKLVGFANSSRQSVAMIDLPKNLILINPRLSNRWLNFRIAVGLGRPLDKLMGGGDIVWLPNFNYVTVSPHIPYVLTIHDLAFMRMPELYDWHGRLWHKILGVKNLVHQAASIITPSQATAEDAAELLKVPVEKIKIIPSGVSMNPPAAPWAEVKNYYHLNDDFILYVGTIEPRKNVESVIAAFSQLLKENSAYRHYQLVLAGPWGWKTKLVKQQIAASSYKEQIKVLGYVEDPERQALYKQARVLIWPSWYEGFGFPVLEAFAASCPVITSISSALLEVAGDAAVLVRLYDQTGLGQALKQVVGDEKLREDLKNRGLARAQQFTWQNTAAKMWQVFENAAK